MLELHGDASLDHFLRGRETLPGIFEMHTLDGEAVSFHDAPLSRVLCGEIVRDDTGAPRFAVFQVSDISERKRVEQEIRELNAALEQRVRERTLVLEQAVKEHEAFSHSVSHDLRARLRAMDGFSQAVLHDHGALLPENCQRCLRIIRESAQKPGQLIDDLLAFSRASRQQPNKRPVDHAMLVRSALQQVWINLLSNALKYSRRCTPAVTEVGAVARAGVPNDFVRDNAHRFRHALRAQAVRSVRAPAPRRRRRRAPASAWRSCSVSCSATAAACGPNRHRARARPSASAWEPMPNETFPACRDPHRRGQPHDLEMTLRGLEKARLVNQIQVARDAAEALDFVFCEGEFAGRSFEDRPRVILLDLKLPKVDGLEVPARLKGDARTRTIPVVMLTSSQKQRDLVASCELGVNSHIVKPVQFESFVAAVSELGMYWMLLKQPPAASA